MDIVKTILLVIRMVAFGAFIVFFFTNLFNVTISADSHDSERFSVEISENLLASDLTNGYAVFDTAKLDELDKKHIEPIYSCEFVYLANITDLETHDYWLIGSDFGHIVNSLVLPVKINNSGSIHKGTMLLYIMENPFSKVSCLLNKAEEEGQSNLTLDWSKGTVKNPKKAKELEVEIKWFGNYFCVIDKYNTIATFSLYYPRPTTVYMCRYSSTPLRDFSYEKPIKTLIAIRENGKLKLEAEGFNDE